MIIIRNATEDLVTAVEYCQAILNAESEEELLEVKESIANDLRDYGASEEVIQAYLNQLDSLVEKIENGEYVLNEEGYYERNEAPTQELVETNSPEGAIPSQANTLAGLGLGVVTAALVASMALKKKVFKNKNNKTL